MLVKAIQQVSSISEVKEINNQNYLEAVKYIDNLFTILNHLKKVIPNTKTIIFKPTFKGFHTCELYNIESTEIENLMKFFKLESDNFLEDYVQKSIFNEFTSLCDKIAFLNNELTIVMR